MIRVTDQYFWNFVFLAFFLVFVTMGAIILESESRILLADLVLVDYVLVTLASWRLTQLFTHETITKFFREQFWDVKKVGKGYKLEKSKTGPRRTLADLLGSTGSFGLWITATVAFFYLMTDYAVFPIVLLALSAVVTFVGDLSSFLNVKSED